MPEIERKPEQVIMRFILTEAQADAQFVCLMDRMAEKVADERANIYGVGDGDWQEMLERAKSPPCVEGFKNEEMEVASEIHRLMALSQAKGFRLGSSVLALYLHNISQ